jgi:DNA polymerase-3 subunit epsilon
MGWHEGALLGFDLETTGIDPCSDLPVQVALVLAEPGRLLSSDVFIVDPGREIPPGAEAIHGISTERARREGRSLAEAAHTLRSALQDAEDRGVPVVAMNASFDLTIAAALFDAFSHAPASWSMVVDPLVIDRKVDQYRSGKRRLDALCVTYGIELHNAHDAGGDAEATIELARVIGKRFPEIGALDARELTVLEVQWHREWATSYDAWRRESGKPGLSPEEFAWPLRRKAGAPPTTIAS